MNTVDRDTILNEIKNKTLTIVNFSAEWCQPCKILTPNLEIIEKEYEDVKFLKFDINTEKMFPQGLGIKSIPTTIFYKDNKELHRATGSAQVDEIRQEVEEYK